VDAAGEDTTGKSEVREARAPSAGEPPLVSIVVATFNERDNIEGTIAAIFRHVRPPVEVVVVDDASPDGTGGFVEGLADARVRVVHRRGGKGLASAIMRGVMESRGGVVGWIDADMGEESECLARMLSEMDGCDVAVASRFVEGGGDKRAPFRVLCSRLVNGFANLVLGYGIKDYDSCVAVVRRSVFDVALPLAYGYGDFFIEFVYQCCRRGLKVVEVPYVLLPRAEGDSKSYPGLAKFLWLGLMYGLRIVAARFRRD
jgi:glycosyltransferase involved in cell wall biosynthesis